MEILLKCVAHPRTLDHQHQCCEAVRSHISFSCFSESAEFVESCRNSVKLDQTFNKQEISVHHYICDSNVAVLCDQLLCFFHDHDDFLASKAATSPIIIFKARCEKG